MAFVILLTSPVTESVAFKPYTPSFTSDNCTTGFSAFDTSSSGVSVGVGVGVALGNGVGLFSSSTVVIFKLSSNS